MKILNIVSVGILLSLMACNQQPDDQLADQGAERKSEDRQVQMPVTPDSTSRNGIGAETSASPGNSQWDRMIVKNAVVSIEVGNYHQYHQRLYDAVKQNGGYISNEEESKDQNALANKVSIRVPVGSFEQLMVRLTDTGVNILTRAVTANDVTSKVFDTRARLATKKKVRDRYLELFAKAKNMDEVLQVENQVNQMQEQIDAGEGQIQYLSHASAFSTIELTFKQWLLAPEVPVAEPGFAARLLRSLRSGATVFEDLVLGLAVLWPLWMLLGGVYLLYRRSRMLSRAQGSKVNADAGSARSGADH